MNLIAFARLFTLSIVNELSNDFDCIVAYESWNRFSSLLDSLSVTQSRASERHRNPKQSGTITRHKNAADDSWATCQPNNHITHPLSGEKRNLGNLAQRAAIIVSSELNANLNIKEGNSLLKWWCEQHRGQMNILPIV